METGMDTTLRNYILKVLKEHRLLTLATLRPDGWPQATTVGYGSDGLILYFLCAADSQKAKNLARCNKVSLAIDHDSDEMLGIRGLSMAAVADFVTDTREIARIWPLLMAKYPALKDIPMPDPKTVTFVRLTPKIISVLDYSKGFGHTDLVVVEPQDMKAVA